MVTHYDSIISWRGITIPTWRQSDYYVYLLHFDKPHYHAKHYLGATGCLDGRLAAHHAGYSAHLMQAVKKAGIGFKLARLWRCESWEESRDLERRLKRRHGSNVLLCPLCQGKPLDDEVFMRQGHQRLAWRFEQTRPRRPMSDFQKRRPVLE